MSSLRSAIVGAGMLAAAITGSASAADFSAEQTDAIGKIVREYLLEHPEVLIEALEAYEQRQTLAENDRRLKIIEAHSASLYEDSNSFAAGPPDADVTIVEFFDYHCGFCKKSLSVITQALQSDKNIRVVFKEYPILSEDSVTASRAAVASIRQGKYFEFHNAMMSQRGRLNEQKVLEIARDVGIDDKRLKHDMYQPDVSEVIRANYQLAEALGVRGTPAWLIGKEFVPGAVSAERFAEYIAQARATAAKATN